MPLHLVEGELTAGTLAELRPANFTSPIALQLHAMWRRTEPPGPTGRWLLERLAPADRLDG